MAQNRSSRLPLPPYAPVPVSPPLLIPTIPPRHTNLAPPSPFVSSDFPSPLPQLPSIFDEFDPVPIASASLAQVHVTCTHQGQKVAVEVQHVHMTDTAAADYATVELIVNTLHRLFPSFDYRN